MKAELVAARIVPAVKFRYARLAGRLSGTMTGRTVECNLCGYRTGRMLSDDWHRNVICPGCGSQVRHRLLAAILAGSGENSLDRLIVGKRILHFAPEPVIERLIRPHAAKYVRADMDVERYGSGEALQLDISNMTAVESAAFDTVIACDVLEHVPDHLAANREIKRVLVSGGTAILTVPQPDHISVTYEDSSITSPEARTVAYGQFDHVRLYGNDFGEILSREGFEVTCIQAGDLPDQLVNRNVLEPPEPGASPLATNRRRIYFARKP